MLAHLNKNPEKEAQKKRESGVQNPRKSGINRTKSDGVTCHAPFRLPLARRHNQLAAA